MLSAVLDHVTGSPVSSWPIIYLMSSQIKRCNGGKPDRDHFKILPPSCITADTSAWWP